MLLSFDNSCVVDVGLANVVVMPGTSCLRREDNLRRMGELFGSLASNIVVVIEFCRFGLPSGLSMELARTLPSSVLGLRIDDLFPRMDRVRWDKDVRRDTDSGMDDLLASFMFAMI